MSHTYFHAGERFLYVVDAYRYPDRKVAGQASNQFHLYVALEVYGEFYFHDDWTQDVEYTILDNLSPGETEAVTIFDFEWPDVDGSAVDISLWSVIIEADSGDMHGRYDQLLFAYGPPPPTSTPVPEPTATPVQPEMKIDLNNDDSPLGWDCEDERMYCFGEHASTTSSYRIARVTNTGGAEFVVRLEVIGATPGMFISQTAMAFLLDPGDSELIEFIFDPHAPPGDKSATLVIEGAGDREEIELLGTFVF